MATFIEAAARGAAGQVKVKNGGPGPKGPEQTRRRREGGSPVKRPTGPSRRRTAKGEGLGSRPRFRNRLYLRS